MLCRSFHRCKKQNQIPQAIAAQALYGIKMQMSKLKTYFLQRRDCFILMCFLSVFLSSIFFSALTFNQKNRRMSTLVATTAPRMRICRGSGLLTNGPPDTHHPPQNRHKSLPSRCPPPQRPCQIPPLGSCHPSLQSMVPIELCVPLSTRHRHCGPASWKQAPGPRPDHSFRLNEQLLILNF